MKKVVLADLAPLVKEDATFHEVSPDLLEPEFSKQAKEHLDQPQTGSTPFFQKGHPSWWAQPGEAPATRELKRQAFLVSNYTR
jgi:hypothetical protein